jgi:hypothetical protein
MDILLLFLFIITEDHVKKNGTKVTQELRIVVWRPYFLITGLQRAPDWDCFLLQYYSAKTTFV